MTESQEHDRDEPDDEGLTDDETPVGDTAEGHTDINPHDLPPDHPNRHDVERSAERRGEQDASVSTERDPENLDD